MQCCPLTGADGDGPSVFTERTITARKEHRCCECRGAIAAGETYQRVDGCWDGSWSTYKTCAICVEIRDHFACEGFLFERLWSDLEENFFPDMKAGGPCMEGLSPAAKARLFERRMEWLEERAR